MVILEENFKWLLHLNSSYIHIYYVNTFLFWMWQPWFFKPIFKIYILVSLYHRRSSSSPVYTNLAFTATDSKLQVLSINSHWYWMGRIYTCYRSTIRRQGSVFWNKDGIYPGVIVCRLCVTLLHVPCSPFILGIPDVCHDSGVWWDHVLRFSHNSWEIVVCCASCEGTLHKQKCSRVCAFATSSSSRIASVEISRVCFSHSCLIISFFWTRTAFVKSAA